MYSAGKQLLGLNLFHQPCEVEIIIAPIYRWRKVRLKWLAQGLRVGDGLHSPVHPSLLDMVADVEKYSICLAHCCERTVAEELCVFWQKGILFIGPLH